MEKVSYTSISKNEALSLRAEVEKKYADYVAQNLKLDMSRGKPAPNQLDMSEDLFTVISKNSDVSDVTPDVRNYGGLDGIPEMKAIFADMLGVKTSEVIIGGNASLTMMFDMVSRSVTHGVLGSTPWCKLPKVKFLCPSPGYDRHFTICECFGIEMITIPMKSDGPDMDKVKEYVENDPAVKGIWCVPKYQNPTGITFSDEVVKKFASLKPAAEDFRIFWDNAYCVHDLYEEEDQLLNILDECRKNGNEDMCYIFASTSKISFPGAGVAAMAMSEKNIAFTKKILAFQMIGPDKINQLRHVKYFKNLDGIRAHMKKHAQILAPKFEIVLDTLTRELEGLGVANWTAPRGGYFISLDVMPGTAKRVHKLMAEAGVVMTGCGATFPYGNDPDDTNLRIAPSYPSVAELKTASELLCVCVKLAALEKITG
ncbi:MAG: aminotransferase class I/II-fold pyridoxal phosphate-dependent enzyme [Oscillospiraceae bacterium]|nr:aminotransferase class I/II-fold pyridoxal phosphate-dependent enzyme [Oscillospiraceae bacterium]